jgi:PhzF family phenazine biosynthesis protein
MNLQIFQVDAFTKAPLSGNPAAVCPLDEWLPDEMMQKIAAENNLAETAFFVKEDDVYEIRWFTPTVEVNLCGHATLASAFVIFNHLGETANSIKLHSRRSGDLGVEKADDKLVLDFPTYPVRQIEPIAALANAEFSPQSFWEAGNNKLMLVMESQTIVAGLKPSMQMLSKLSYDGVIVTAKGDDCDFALRFFAPRIGIPEDPVTGGVQCSLIPYWAEQLGKIELFAKQISARGGELFCELKGERVKIGGNAVLYLKGEIYI